VSAGAASPSVVTEGLAIRLSIAPLEQLLLRRYGPQTDRWGCEVLSAAEVANLVGVDKRTVARWRAHGVDAHQADRAATAAGWHPIEVWGEAWAASVPEPIDRSARHDKVCEDCDQPFVARRSDARFCSSRCSSRFHHRAARARRARSVLNQSSRAREAVGSEGSR
jgi:hypothetical protein